MKRSLQNVERPVKTKRKAKPARIDPMETPSDRLKKAREQRYATAAEAARAFGWKVETYQAHEGGKDIGKEALIRYAAAYGMTLDYLMTGKQNFRHKSDNVSHPLLALRLIPILDRQQLSLSVGISDMLKISSCENVSVSSKSKIGPKARAIAAFDNSMEDVSRQHGKSILSGDEVIFDPDAALSPGDLVVAKLSGPDRVAIRKYAKGGDGIVRLVAINPFFGEDRIGSPEDGFILGRVVRIIQNV